MIVEYTHGMVHDTIIQVITLTSLIQGYQNFSLPNILHLKRKDSVSTSQHVFYNNCLLFRLIRNNLGGRHYHISQTFPPLRDSPEVSMAIIACWRMKLILGLLVPMRCKWQMKAPLARWWLCQSKIPLQKEICFHYFSYINTTRAFSSAPFAEGNNYGCTQLKFLTSVNLFKSSS